MEEKNWLEPNEILEEIAMCDDDTLEQFMEIMREL